VLLSLPLLPACANAGFAEADVEAPRPEPLSLEVTNQSSSDVIIYRTDGGVPIRLGRVEAMHTTQLIIHHVPKADMLVRLMLRSGSGESYTPESVWAAAGETVELIVRSLLRTSDMTVRTPGEVEPI
jgi:hypothetical protein